MNQSSASSVLGTSGILDQSLPLTVGEAVVVVVLLLLALAGNALQLYQRRVYARTVYNELVGTFNSVGWLLVRCMSRTEQLNNRVKGADRYVAEAAILREFRDYSLETEFKLHVLHEQLVSMAKTLRVRGHWGYTPEEKERIEERYGATLKRVG
jgi:hypothetical protein